MCVLENHGSHAVTLQSFPSSIEAMVHEVVHRPSASAGPICAVTTGVQPPGVAASGIQQLAGDESDPHVWRDAALRGWQGTLHHIYWIVF